MATSNTAIKITALPNIGNNIAPSTLIPVVNMAGVPTTQKANLQITGNLILAGAGTANFVPAALANLAYTVVNSNQANITRLGTLNINTLKVVGGVNGYILQTDGTGNLAWVSGGGSGNGVVGGSNTQVQFNNAGDFGGATGFTFDNTSNILTVVGNIDFSGDPSAAPSLNDFFSVTSAANFAIVTDNANTDKTWSFGDDGTLTLPGGGYSGDYYDISSANGISIVSQGDSTRLSWVRPGATPIGNISYSTAFLDDTGISLTFTSHIAEGSYSDTLWKFGQDGSLTLPFEGPIVSNGSINIETGPYYIYGITGFNGGGADVQISLDDLDTIVSIGDNITDGSGATYQVTAITGTNPEWTITTSWTSEEPNLNAPYSFSKPDITGGTWQFGNDGNLTLPANTFAVNYANGTSVSLGNIQSSIANGNSNISIANANGNIVITSNGTKEWIFDSTGNLNVPGNIIGSASANLIIYSNAGVHEFLFGADGTFYSPDNVVLGGSSISIGPGANTLAGIGNAVFIASSNSTAYIQGAITNVSDIGSADWAAYGHRGDDNGGWIDMGFNSSGYAGLDYPITGPGDGSLLVESYYDGQSPGGRGGNLIIATGSQGTISDIIFATGGFQIANEFMRISNANNALELTRAGAAIIFNTGTDGNIDATGNINVIANGNTWTFDTEGTLSLPPNSTNPSIGVIQSANGFPTLLAYGSDGAHGGPELDWMDADDPAVNFYENTVLRNTIYLNRLGLYIGMNENEVVGNFSGWWSFGADGTTTFPDNTLKTVNGANAVVPGTAGTAGDPLTISAGTGGIAATSLNAGAGGNLTITAGDAGSDIGNPSWGEVGGTLVLRGGNSTQPYNGSNVEIRSGNSASIPGVISLYTGTNQWTFGNDGNLTLPTGGTLIVSGSIVSSGASPAPTLSGFSSVSALQFTNGSSNVTINANSTTWQFSTNGNLTLPQGGAITNNIPLATFDILYQYDDLVWSGNTLTFTFASSTYMLGVLALMEVGDAIILDGTPTTVTGAYTGGGGGTFTVSGTGVGQQIGQYTLPNRLPSVNGIKLTTNSKNYLFTEAGVTQSPVLTVDTLPSGQFVLAGFRAFVSDANLAPVGNFGAIVGNSGSNTVSVWCDGTNWRIG